MKTSMQFSTLQQPSQFLSHQPGRKSQTPNPFPEHSTKQEAPEKVPALAGRGHFPKELLSIGLENNSLCSLHSLQQYPNSPWIRRSLLNSNQKTTITRGHIWAWAQSQIWPLVWALTVWWKSRNILLTCCIPHKGEGFAWVASAGDTEFD